jgi:hypothetical protein
MGCYNEELWVICLGLFLSFWEYWFFCSTFILSDYGGKASIMHFAGVWRH